jgi:L,D-transpeptidase catalytic domain
MKIKKLLLLCVLFSVLTPALAATPFWGSTKPVPFETPPDLLKNGEFTWDPEIAPAGPIQVLVSLDEQRAYTYRNGILIGTASVSTGKPGHETPTGVFTTKLKDKDHHSSIYNNAAMPYTQRITSDGVALHAGGVPGYPESHGCVHLPSEYARLLFDAAPLGMTVVIADHKTQPEFVDHPAFLSPITDKGELAANARLFADQPYRWEPEKSAVGTASMVVSRYDSRIVVLRNGVEIGRAKVQFREPEAPVGTHVFVAHDPVGTQPRWTKVGMIGHLDDANTLPDSDVVNRIIMPQEFQQRLSPLLVSGTTMMVTDAPILEHTTGPTITVMTSHPGI